jgi:hypothetical protein
LGRALKMDIFQNEDFKNKDWINGILENVDSEENLEKVLRDCINQVTITEKNLEIEGEKEMRTVYSNLPTTLDDFAETQSNFDKISAELAGLGDEIKSNPKQKTLFDDLSSYSRLKEKTSDLISDLNSNFPLHPSLTKSATLK